MSFKKYTFRNHSGSYRIPVRSGLQFGMDSGEKNQVDPFFVGDFANRLGEYEAIGSPEEFAKLKGMDYDSIRAKTAANS